MTSMRLKDVKHLVGSHLPTQHTGQRPCGEASLCKFPSSLSKSFHNERAGHSSSLVTDATPTPQPPGFSNDTIRGQSVTNHLQRTVSQTSKICKGVPHQGLNCVDSRQNRACVPSWVTSNCQQLRLSFSYRWSLAYDLGLLSSICSEGMYLMETILQILSLHPCPRGLIESWRSPERLECQVFITMLFCGWTLYSYYQNVWLAAC